MISPPLVTEAAITWLLVRMYPLLSMTKPDPVEPPLEDFASIETTDGNTRCAISATEPAGLSMADVDFTKFTERPKSDPDDEAPKARGIIKNIGGKKKPFNNQVKLV